jgi:ParB family chromosome partitioning protein
VRKQALGRGLSALLPADSPPSEGGPFIEIPLDQLLENPFQPRRSFDPARLQELADSIRVHGVVQPVVVTAAPGGWRLVVGERRVRAARLAGLNTVPAVVREMADQERLEVALIENLQREDLNPVEEARAYSYLLREHGLTHEQLAGRLGRSRPAISNALRLLALPEEILADLEAGVLSAGHARALLPLEDGPRQVQVWRQVQRRGLSVRQTEELVGRLLEGRPAPATPPLSDEWLDLQERLTRGLGATVRIRPRGRGRGRIELHYRDPEHLERLVGLLVYLGERRS